jgi:ribokinase
MYKYMEIPLVGVGALNVDLIYEAENLIEISRIIGEKITPGSEISCTAERLPKLLGYLKTDGKFMGKSGGGSAANCVYAFVNMGGGKCSYIGKVGTDENSDFLLAGLQTSGIDISNIIREPGYCGICLSINMDSGRTMLIFPNKNDELVKGDIKAIPPAEYFHFTSFACLRGDGPLEAQTYIARQAKLKGSKVSFDPGELYAKRGQEPFKEILENTDILFVNEKEAELLGTDSISVPVLAKKLGKHGSRIYWNDEGTKREATIKPYDRGKSVEDTGAGDVYAAGFLAAQLEGAGPLLSADFGNFVGAKSITKPGREAYPTREDFNAFWKD